VNLLAEHHHVSLVLPFDTYPYSQVLTGKETNHSLLFNTKTASAKEKTQSSNDYPVSKHNQKSGMSTGRLDSRL